MDWNVLGLLLAVVISCTVCQEDICSYRPGRTQENFTMFTVAAMSSSDWGAEGACHCTLRSDGSAESKLYVSLALHTMDDNSEDDAEMCTPLFYVTFQQVSSQPRDLSENFYMCPLERPAGKHKSLVVIKAGQEMTIHLDNPNKEAMEAMVMIEGSEMSVECSSTDRIIYETCPCYDPMAAATKPEPGFDATTRLGVGLGVAFGFLVILAVVIVAFVCYRKRKGKADKPKSYNEGSAVNKAYEGSKHSVNDSKQPPPRDANVNFQPDPTLNLTERQPHHGSRDSGLASSQEPTNDKRLPFMQQPRTGSSLDNLTRMGDNYPPLAGHGSQSSLDHNRSAGHVEPVYTTHSQALSNEYGPPPAQDPYAGPLAGNPDYQPPLAGHGSQHSLDEPRLYEGGDVVYAKLPPRSASFEHLQVGFEEEPARASGESLNASRVTIETDV